jgi:UrcA family protein
MGYTVTSKGLDIGTPAGAREFEGRVKDAATAACRELGQRYPNSSTSDSECVKKATDKAMAQAHQLEDAAAKKK